MADCFTFFLTKKGKTIEIPLSLSNDGFNCIGI